MLRPIKSSSMAIAAQAFRVKNRISRFYFVPGAFAGTGASALSRWTFGPRTALKTLWRTRSCVPRRQSCRRLSPVFQGCPLSFRSTCRGEEEASFRSIRGFSAIAEAGQKPGSRAEALPHKCPGPAHTKPSGLAWKVLPGKPCRRGRSDRTDRKTPAADSAPAPRHRKEPRDEFAIRPQSPR